ncbi:MAG TPA: hypothetical protein VH934_23935 [Xanthobacteraceae bacterium]|jgi:hypothetical protein
MRKMFIVFGILAVAAIAAAWSISTLPASKAHKTGTIQESGAISPHDLMVIKGKALPSEAWDAF